MVKALSKEDIRVEEYERVWVNDGLCIVKHFDKAGKLEIEQEFYEERWADLEARIREGRVVVREYDKGKVVRMYEKEGEVIKEFDGEGSLVREYNNNDYEGSIKNYEDSEMTAWWRARVATKHYSRY